MIALETGLQILDLFQSYPDVSSILVVGDDVVRDLLRKIMNDTLLSNYSVLRNTTTLNLLFTFSNVDGFVTNIILCCQSWLIPPLVLSLHGVLRWMHLRILVFIVSHSFAFGRCYIFVSTLPLPGMFYFYFYFLFFIFYFFIFHLCIILLFLKILCLVIYILTDLKILDIWEKKSWHQNQMLIWQVIPVFLFKFKSPLLHLVMSEPGHPNSHGLFVSPLYAPLCFYRIVLLIKE